jgi:hypothetical protein
MFVSHSWTILTIESTGESQFSLPAMENPCKKERIAAASAAMRIGFAKMPCDWRAKQIRSIALSARPGVVVHFLAQATL